jgi:putative salt-induced outer membrane protein YdiY
MKRLAPILWTVTVWMLAVLPVLAEEEGSEGWQSSLQAGLTLTEGNSDSLRGHAGLSLEGKLEDVGALRAGVEGNYGKSRVDGRRGTDVENARAYLSARKTLSRLTFTYFNLTALHDGQAKVDYRVVLGPGLGWLLYTREQTELSVELGPSYLWEQVDDVRDDFLVLRLAQRLEHSFGDRGRLWQQAEYLPKSDDFDDYLLNGEIGIESNLNARMSLRVVLQSSYDSTPAEDREGQDLSLISGISVRL